MSGDEREPDKHARNLLIAVVVIVFLHGAFILGAMLYLPQ